MKEKENLDWECANGDLKKNPIQAQEQIQIIAFPNIFTIYLASISPSPDPEASSYIFCLLIRSDQFADLASMLGSLLFMRSFGVSRVVGQACLSRLLP